MSGRRARAGWGSRPPAQSRMPPACNWSCFVAEKIDTIRHCKCMRWLTPMFGHRCWTKTNLLRFTAVVLAALFAFAPLSSLSQKRVQIGELKFQKRSCESRQSMTVIIRDSVMTVRTKGFSFGGSRYEQKLSDQERMDLESILEFWDVTSTPVPWPKDEEKCTYAVSWSGKRAKYSWNKRAKTVPSSIMAIWDWMSKRTEGLYGRRYYWRSSRHNWGGRGGSRGEPRRNPRSDDRSHPQDSPGDTKQGLPDFPYPPPAASTLYVLPRDVFPDTPTIGQVTDSILAALERNGYVERGFFRMRPDGIALVTRLERINDDGSSYPEPNRWPAEWGHRTLSQILWSLFYVNAGRYRVIVFVLNEAPFSTSTKEPTGNEARDWLRTGANTLPSDIAQKSYGSRKCTALIYEFSSDGRARLVQGPLTARQHLEKAGVMQALAPTK